MKTHMNTHTQTQAQMQSQASDQRVLPHCPSHVDTCPVGVMARMQFLSPASSVPLGCIAKLGTAVSQPNEAVVMSPLTMVLVAPVPAQGMSTCAWGEEEKEKDKKGEEKER